MKGDFTRIIYNERKHYSLVLMQQGRVQLDSDWNEQALLHWISMQNLTEDLIGEHGGPRDNPGFEIVQIINNDVLNTSDFTIRRGRYYVHGLLCGNEADVAYTKQDAYPFPGSLEMEQGKKYLVYLHVWWRHMTSEEDDNIREVALGGPDTTSRIQTISQVKLIEYEGNIDKKFKSNYEEFKTFMQDKGIINPTTGKLQAQALKPSDSDEPCIISPQNRFRGNENQFYRVEIHRSGPACTLDDVSTNAPCATFKWSRENGSVVFPVLALNDKTLTLEHLGRDDRFGLTIGDWVELVDDNFELQRRAEVLFKVVDVDSDNLKVTLSGSPQHEIDLLKHTLLRRWDHVGETQYQGTLPIVEDKWIELEDGVQILFPQPLSENNVSHWYQSGSWWWIPARNITGDVQWPQENGQPLAQGAFDAGDRYAPLALLESNTMQITDLRRKVKKLWE